MNHKWINYMQTFGIRIIKYLSLLIIVSIIFANVSYNLFIFAGYHITYNVGSLKPFLIALVLCFGLAFFVAKIKINAKGFIIGMIIINLISFLIKLILIHSFEVGPAGDTWEVFYAAESVFNGQFESLIKGGYISTYMHQLGGMTFLLPQVAFFGRIFSNYYTVNAILMQLSTILSVLIVKRFSDNKTGLFANLMIISFVPNYFYIFVLYNEVVTLFLVVFALFIATRNSIHFILKWILVLIVLSLAIFMKTYVAVIVIALAILVLLYSGFNFKLILKLSLILSLLVLPSLFFRSIYNLTLDTSLGKNALPASTWLIVGLSGPGYTSRYANLFVENNHDSKRLNMIIDEEIDARLNQFKDLNLFKDFVKAKFLYTWTDQDLDSMNYVMPSQYAIPLSEFENDNSLRIGRASSTSKPINSFGFMVYDKLFTIRNVEKILYFLYLFLALINLLMTFNKKKVFNTFIELTLIGFTILLIIIETQPRYIYLIMNMMLMYSSLAVYEINALKK